eukprot:367570_1
MFGFNKKGKCITRAFKTANVQPTPCIFGDNKIIYCTRYEPENELSTGIFQYNTLTNYHTTIALWKDIKYYPRWNTTIVSSKRNIFISAAGVNVKNGNENYALLLIFNLKTKQHSKINIGMQLGKNPKLLFSNNDNHLHIIGGTESGKHMLFDLTNNQMSQIYDFNQMNPGISSQMLLYSKTKNVIIMFGGLHHNGETLFDDFWTCEMHNYKWTKKDQFKLPKRREAAGAVLYRDRVIIMFGGRTPKRESESLYYLDLKGINGWNKSKITLPKGGRYNAILMKNDKIHVLPYYSHEHHYEINVTDILPHLLLKDVNEETKLNDEYDEKKDVTNIISANSTSKSNKSPKLSSNLTPSLSPTNALINSNTFLKPGMDSMILSVPQTMQNMKETQSDNDSKLKQHLKLSNSKIIIIKQIMDQINDKSNQLYAPYSRHRYCIYYAGYILGTLCRISESMCNKILNEPQFVSSILSLWKGSSTWMESTCATKAIVYIMQHKPKAFITHKDAQNVNIITSAIDLYINCVKSVLKTCIVPDKMNGLVIDLLNITRGKMYEHDYNVLVERSWIKSEDWSALNLQILYRLAETNDKSIMDMFESVTTAQWEDACGMALCWIWCGELKIRLNSLDLLIYVTKHEKCAEIISKSDLIIKCLIMKLYSRTCMHKRYD